MILRVAMCKQSVGRSVALCPTTIDCPLVLMVICIGTILNRSLASWCAGEAKASRQARLERFDRGWPMCASSVVHYGQIGIDHVEWPVDCVEWSNLFRPVSTIIIANHWASGCTSAGEQPPSIHPCWHVHKLYDLMDTVDFINHDLVIHNQLDSIVRRALLCWPLVIV